MIFGVAALIAVGATTLRAPERAAAANCSARTPGDVRVAVVVDYGTALRPSGLTRHCVTVPRGSSGMVALRAAVGSVGTDSSGKVCQIGPVPVDYDAANCSAPQNGMLSYWAYFHGDASGWTYSSVGAGGSRARSDVVEGWHFVTMPVSQQNSAPPPRNFTDGPSAAWQSTCPSVTAPQPTTPSRRAGGGVAPIPDASAAPRPTDPPAATTTPPAATSTTRRPGSPSTSLGSSPTTKPAGTGLRSTETAPLLSHAQVAAAAKAAEPSSRPVVAIVAGAGGVGTIVLGLVLLTRRSRRRRMLDAGPDG